MQLQSVFSHYAQHPTLCAHVSNTHLQRRPLKILTPKHADFVALRHCKADARSLRRHRSLLQHAQSVCTLRTAAAGISEVSGSACVQTVQDSFLRMLLCMNSRECRAADITAHKTHRGPYQAHGIEVAFKPDFAAICTSARHHQSAEHLGTPPASCCSCTCCLEHVCSEHKLQDSEDVRLMVGALKDLGVKLEEHWANHEIIVHGCEGKFPTADAKLNLGNAGTAMR